jgi:hypothetical protein
VFRVVGSCLVVLGATTAVLAQGDSGAEFRLVVHPAKEPMPALKYQLAFELRDQTPGNAAVQYFRAALVYEAKRNELGVEKRREQVQRLEQWRGMSLADLPRAEMRAFFDHYKPVLVLLERAARCQHCDWEVVDAVRRDGFGALLPELQQIRGLAALLQDKARLDMAEGNLDQAARTLRIGLTLVRDCGESPLLINSLVGFALGQIMLGQLDQFVQQPGAPNLYWALTDLPHPLVDLRRTFQGERIVVDSLFPGMREALAKARIDHVSPAEAELIVDRLITLLSLGGRGGRPVAGGIKPEVGKKFIAEAVEKMRPAASEYLKDRGWPGDQVNALPGIVVVVLHQIGEYDQFFGEISKWPHVPYWQARASLQETEDQVQRLVAKSHTDETFSLVHLMLPTAQRVYLANVRAERKVAALRCVEAVRLYAAAHDGKPPAKLDDVKEVPIPLDPFTGKPFTYNVEGDKAVIEGPAPDGENKTADKHIRYEVTILR